MERFERIQIVAEEMEQTLKRIRYEYNMSVAEMIGIIELLKLNLYDEEKGGENDE